MVLVDENDNAPQFRAVEYRMSIKANVAKGSLVTQIQAADPDAGSNGRIIYSLYSEARLSLVDVLEVSVSWSFLYVFDLNCIFGRQNFVFSFTSCTHRKKKQIFINNNINRIKPLTLTL